MAGEGRYATPVYSAHNKGPSPFVFLWPSACATFRNRADIDRTASFTRMEWSTAAAKMMSVSEVQIVQRVQRMTCQVCVEPSPPTRGRRSYVENSYLDPATHEVFRSSMTWHSSLPTLFAADHAGGVRTVACPGCDLPYTVSHNLFALPTSIMTLQIWTCGVFMELRCGGRAARETIDCPMSPRRGEGPSSV